MILLVSKHNEKLHKIGEVLFGKFRYILQDCAPVIKKWP